MTEIERIATRIGTMSDISLSELALELVRMHGKRTERLASYLLAYEQDEQIRVREKLGLDFAD